MQAQRVFALLAKRRSPAAGPWRLMSLASRSQPAPIRVIKEVHGVGDNKSVFTFELSRHLSSSDSPSSSSSHPQYNLLPPTPTPAVPISLSSVSNSLSAASNRALLHFLPSGFPQTTSKTYSTYAFYQFLAAITGSAAGVLSMQSLLYAVGLGAGSIPLAGALNWVMKDGLGQLGGVLFASYHGASRSFDADPKRWRQFSALTMDLSTFVEILSPLFPSLFLPIAAAANVGKNISYLSASASRAALHGSMCLSGNLADVTAKAGSQTILASVLGTALGVGISPLIGTDVLHVALGFGALSIGTQGGTFLSLKGVAVTTVNSQRMDLLLTGFLKSRKDLPGEGGITEMDLLHEPKLFGMGSAPTPEDVGQNEVFLPFQNSVRSSWLNVGCTLSDLLPSPSSSYDPDLSSLRAVASREKYVLLLSMSSRGSAAVDSIDGQCAQGSLALLEGATGHDTMRGVLHAYLARDRLERILKIRKAKGLSASGVGCTREEVLQIIKTTLTELNDCEEDFMRQCEERGWKMKAEGNINLEKSKSVRLVLEEGANE